MNITWHGEGAIKLQSGDALVLIDPYGKASGLTALRAHMDIVCLTNGSRDKENAKSIKDPKLVIEGPGEYEAEGVIIEGIETNFGGDPKENSSIFVVHAEGMNLCHLGDLNKQLEQKQIDAIGNIDILLVPCGGGDVLDAKKAVELSNQLEPRVVVPIYYKVKGVKTNRADVKDFLKEIGASDVKPEKTLSLKKHKLPQDETQITLLEKN